MTGPSSGDRPAEETCQCPMDALTGRMGLNHHCTVHGGLVGAVACTTTPPVRAGDEALVDLGTRLLLVMLSSKHPANSGALAVELATEAWAALATPPPVSGTATRDDGLRARVEALTYASDDGTEYEHNGHGANEGEPECPGCWADSLRRALDGAR